MKFQLTRDTLEAMLRSMTYISEQLSSLVSMLLSVGIYKFGCFGKNINNVCLNRCKTGREGVIMRIQLKGEM